MPLPSAITTLVVAGIQEPSVDEFLAHPDFRQIAAFFLGWVFISSFSCILYSSTFRRFISGLFATSDNNVPDPEVVSDKLSTWTTSGLNKGDNHTLLFALCIFFAFASVAYFSSLLAFDPNNGAAACAFVIAWGGMAAQSARLVGLLILSFELRQLGIGRWEEIVFWIWLGIGLIFVFVTNAISTGTTKVVQQLAVSLCYRRYFLPTSLISSLVYFFLEFYVIIRLALLIAPTFLQLRHRLGVMADIRVLRGLSLMLLEILTIVPAVTFTGGIVAEFIPFSIGSLAVLAAFSHCTPDEVELRVTSMPPSIISSYHSRRSTTPTVHSVVFPPLDPSLNYEVPYRQSIPNHPFAAKSIDDPALQVDRWQSRPKSARSSLSIGSPTVKSIRDAVIQVASKGSRAPATRLPQGTFPLPLSTRNFPPSEFLDEGERASPVHARLHPGRPQQILPDQAKYAEQLERQSLKKRVPPAILIDPSSPSMQSWPSAEPITAKSPRSPDSVVYGSDIIRVARRSSTTTDATRRTSQSGGATSSYHSYLTSPRDTLTSSTARSSRRYSYAYPREDMPVLYKVPIDEISRTNDASLPRRRTFGQQSFPGAPVLEPPPRAVMGFPSSPRAGSSGPRIRGPRPPPTSPLRADRRYMTTMLPPERGGDEIDQNWTGH